MATLMCADPALQTPRPAPYPLPVAHAHARRPQPAPPASQDKGYKAASSAYMFFAKVRFYK